MSLRREIEGTRPGVDRPFRLVHLMLLIAGVALTLTVVPSILRSVVNLGPALNRLGYLSDLVTLALTSWTFFLATIGLVADLPRLRRAGRSYGTSALFATSVVLGFLFAFEGFELLLMRWALGITNNLSLLDHSFYRLWFLLSRIPEVAAASVVAAGTTLALAGVGRKPSGWLESSGLIMGCCWLAWYPVRGLLWMLGIPWLEEMVPTPI